MTALPSGTVTFLFTDIEGSTRLLQQLKDGYADVLTECRRLVRTAVQERGGQEVDTEGDAVFAAFPSAREALLAAVAAQRGILRHPWPDGAAVRVRMGLHTGEACVTEDSYVGMDVHRAARICAAAHGGQILVSDTIYALVTNDLPDGVSLRDLGEHRLKDLMHRRKDNVNDFTASWSRVHYSKNGPRCYSSIVKPKQQMISIERGREMFDPYLWLEISYQRMAEDQKSREQARLADKLERAQRQTTQASAGLSLRGLLHVPTLGYNSLLVILGVVGFFGAVSAVFLVPADLLQGHYTEPFVVFGGFALGVFVGRIYGRRPDD